MTNMDEDEYLRLDAAYAAIGHHVDLSRPATDAEREHYGHDTVGMSGVLAAIQHDDEDTWLVMDWGMAMPWSPDLTVTVTDPVL